MAFALVAMSSLGGAERCRTLLTEIIIKYCRTRLEQILLAEDENAHYGVPVSLIDHLQAFSPQLGHALLQQHAEFSPLLEDAVAAAQVAVMEGSVQRSSMSVKQHIHAHLFDMPLAPGHYFANVSALRARDSGKFVSVPGTVIRCGTVKMLIARQEFECSKCGNRFFVDADPAQGHVLEKPQRCGQGGERSNCKGGSFDAVEGGSVCMDYQELRIQEQVKKLGMGSIPRSMLVSTTNDLVDSCQAGDDVVVTGVIRERWRPCRADEPVDLDTYLDASYISVMNDKKGARAQRPDLIAKFDSFWVDHKSDPFAARDFIVASVCPQLYGMYFIKLAVALMLIGGVQENARGMRIRGDSHLLLVGDPGTGKSQLLRFAAKVSHRSVMTTGSGTSQAGLVAAAVRDNGEWTLEAGALVLGDRGLVCLDEFGSIRESDRLCIHEAMEQQQVSVAKAGMVCTLQTRATVFATMNPKGSYDSNVPLSVNCAIAGPLLSRFDTTLLMLDTQNEAWDRKVAGHIMAALPLPLSDDEEDAHDDEEGGGAAAEREARALHAEEEKKAEAEEKMHWTIEELAAYIQHVKATFQPVLTPASEAILTAYYQKQRQNDSRNAARTTVRLLESLIRLAQAHARLMYRDVVLPDDAVMSVLMTETSMNTSSILSVTSALHVDFPEEPGLAHRACAEAVYAKLGIDDSTFPDSERAFDYEGHIVVSPAAATASGAVAGWQEEEGVALEKARAKAQWERDEEERRRTQHAADARQLARERMRQQEHQSPPRQQQQQQEEKEEEKKKKEEEEEEEEEEERQPPPPPQQQQEEEEDDVDILEVHDDEELPSSMVPHSLVSMSMSLSATPRSLPAPSASPARSPSRKRKAVFL